jgi:hypothetical protein
VPEIFDALALEEEDVVVGSRMVVSNSFVRCSQSSTDEEAARGWFGGVRGMGFNHCESQSVTQIHEWVGNRLTSKMTFCSLIWREQFMNPPLFLTQDRIL